MKKVCKLKYGISFVVVLMLYIAFATFTSTAYAVQVLEINLETIDGNTVSISWNAIDTATQDGQR